LPSPCLIVLVGPVASGKSTWAAEHFPPDAIVSSDRLRALVGSGEDDIAASADALVLLDEIVARRTARGLTSVVDTTASTPGGARPGCASPVSTSWRASRSRSTPRPASAEHATAAATTPCPPPC
jgi:hypothetical protein